MIIPFEQLSADALQAVIEDWLSRQSQDLTVSFDTRDELIEQVVLQLKASRLFVTWDDESQTTNLVDAESMRDLR